MEVNLNTQISIDKVAQTKFEAAQDKLNEETGLMPLLNRSANLTVSQAPADLDALVAKLNAETADTKETTTKQTLGSAFRNIIAKALESGNIATHNMELLEQAEIYSGQLDSTNMQIDDLTRQISKLQKEVNTDTRTVERLQKEVNNLTQQQAAIQAQLNTVNAKVSNLQSNVDSLRAQLADEADPGIRQQLEIQLKAAEGDLVQAQKEQANLTNQLTANQATLDAAQANLAAAQTKLATSTANLTNAKNALTAANASKADLENKINTTLDDVSDEKLVRDLHDALRQDAANATRITDDAKAERGEEEEKYLDTHNPVRIMQDAVSHHDQELLDTIAEKREEKI